MTYKKMIEEVSGKPEREEVFCTNLPLFAFHYIMVCAIMTCVCSSKKIRLTCKKVITMSMCVRESVYVRLPSSVCCMCVLVT